MVQFLRNMLGLGPATDFKAMVKSGGQIVDVRTKAEFQQGHVKGAINIPLNNLSNHYASLKKDKPVITCCASGVRSAQGKTILKMNGFSEVYNGGGWLNLQRKLR